MYICIYVYICVYVYMYICNLICIYVYIYIYILISVTKNDLANNLYIGLCAHKKTVYIYIIYINLCIYIYIYSTWDTLHQAAPEKPAIPSQQHVDK